MSRFFRIVIRVLGTVALVFLAGALVGVLWGAVRVVTYEQVDDPESLRRKADELARMSAATTATARPNFVVILFDDLGFGDLGAFGSTLKTPHIDALAAEGVILDNYYAAAPNCSPSRAGLLTGRWPVRTTLTHVVFPEGSAMDSAQRALGMPVRLPADEITVAEALRGAGYATAAVGKWHLGDQPGSLPNDLGFDHFFGLLYSNDMSPLPLWRNDQIVEEDPVEQTTLTERYTDEAVRWLEGHHEQPFFLYFPHTFPHIPLFTSAAQQGKSDDGLYGDVVADLDRSVGIVVDTLHRLGVAERTLVIVTSDNGPWFQGSAASVRGRKNSVFEGGMRVPFIAAWPGRLPPATRRAAPAVAMDVFTTVLNLAGVALPSDRIVDGIDLMPLLSAGTSLPERPIFFYWNSELLAVRLGTLKAHRRHGVTSGIPLTDWLMLSLPQGPSLFDLAADADESYDIAMKRSAETEQLMRLMDDFDAEVERNPRGWRRDADERPWRFNSPRP